RFVTDGHRSNEDCEARWCRCDGCRCPSRRLLSGRGQRQSREQGCGRGTGRMGRTHDQRMIPAVSGDAYTAARHEAALIDRSGHGRIVVSGKDRASYLQGLFTNDIAALKAGQGCYAAYLTPQGRMLADLLVYELGDVI